MLACSLQTPALAKCTVLLFSIWSFTQRHLSSRFLPGACAAQLTEEQVWLQRAGVVVAMKVKKTLAEQAAERLLQRKSQTKLLPSSGECCDVEPTKQ